MNLRLRLCPKSLKKVTLGIWKEQYKRNPIFIQNLYIHKENPCFSPIKIPLFFLQLWHASLKQSRYSVHAYLLYKDILNPKYFSNELKISLKYPKISQKFILNWPILSYV